MTAPRDDEYTPVGAAGSDERPDGFSGRFSGPLSGGGPEPPRRRAASPMARRVVLCAMVGAAGALAAGLLRGYQLDLALVTGVAVGLLAFAALRTVDRLRALLRR